MNSTDQPAITKQTSKQSDASYVDSVQRPAPSLPSRSDTSLVSFSLENGDPNNSTKRGPKPKPFALLGRSKSHREKDGRSPRHTPSPQEHREPAYHQHPQLSEPDRAYTAGPTKSAPVPLDRSYTDNMSASSRNRSADRDRAPSRDASSSRNENRDREYGRPHQSSASSRELNGPASFFNNLKREGGRVAETIGKGLFGKSGRSGSTTDRESVVDDEHYVLKVINLPLVEQTRLTRISKRLEESRDKTEFWMPAFPWRAIDYLNYKGCDVEGLYRVPGSGPQIKKWQRRFDEQYDVDLFSQEDLYDINIIGSMLKAWLRELPDELFPKEAQDRIARECVGAEKVPQMLIDELSKLSPFNYYLLFAITCHLSLLLAHSDKNKMDFRNLCICFQPCMKIDAFCFKFLVCDWRDCWKGCKTEPKYIEEEYKFFDQPPPPGLVRKRLEPRMEPRPERRPSPTVSVDEMARDMSSSDSSKKSHQGGGDSMRLKKKNGVQENGNATPKAAPVYNDGPTEGRTVTTRGSNDLRPLSPIKPLSPLGF
ncbi:putative Rho-type GTPase-activating protein 2 [Cytospora mali]|uniref:Rho-type GTPase-activating protein 2 n=1 Tax=Cytospora mali TaxID=578113 RepID=A0A194VRS4_CYTMA|nr:putative Rho-type GTPase-activating protein 2 [Valsa mali]